MFGKREPRSARPFYIYYGLGTPEALDRLRRETLVIVELRQWKSADLSSLRAGGTQVFGYLPVMESPAWNEQRIPQLSDGDYWLQDGQPVRFDKWDSYLMDIRSSAYRRLLLEEWRAMNSGWPIDGIFLDTVGDIEEYIPESRRQEVNQAYRAFLALAASRFPTLRRIQNRGFAQLETCSSLLDGFLWEDWRADWARDAWAARWVHELRKLNRERNLTIYAVSSSDSDAGGKAARKLGFVHRHIDPGYEILPDL
jgi:hypothetical protein